MKNLWDIIAHDRWGDVRMTWVAAWIVLLCLAGSAGIYGLVWLFAPNHGNCQAGTHEVTTGYMPLVVGKTVTVIPITECEANR